jgi:SNF2 family DNA or RNA helicase
MELQIDYDQSRNRALLIPSDHLASSSWSAICRVISDIIPMAIITKNILAMPWRLFLSIKSDIVQLARTYNIKILLSSLARNELLKFEKASYYVAIKNNPISEDQLKKKLCDVGFFRSLTNEQIENVCRLVSLPAGATFSVPGAGKTTEALAYFFYHATEKDHLLVVAPKNAMPAWDEQLKECIHIEDTFIRLRRGEKYIYAILKNNPRFLIITYQQFPLVTDLITKYLIENQVFLYLDESHRIKGGTGKVIADAILQISYLPKRKLIMSGTPMPQTDTDLDSQLSFLYPDVNLKNHSSVEIIQPIYVRTTKDKLGLKPPNRKIITLSLSQQQQEFYYLLKSEAARQIADIPRITRGILRKLGKSIIKLMQFVSNPALLAHDINFKLSKELGQLLISEGGIKIDYACDLARKLASKGEKSIIWSSFVENVELISLRLADIGADYIHGGVDTGNEEESDTREGKVKRFHDDMNAMVLVANPAAAAEGISLHRICHTAIYVDRTFNAAQYLQSEDRIHRLGLSPDIDTNIIILECKKTIDEIIRLRLNEKVVRMAQVLNDPQLNILADIYNDEEDSFGLDERDGTELVKYLRGDSDD